MKCRKLGPLEKFAEIMCYNIVAEHAPLKSIVKKGILGFSLRKFDIHLPD